MLEGLHSIEEDISRYILENHTQIDWYHPTNPQKEWEEWEEQEVCICTKCNSMYDRGTHLSVKKDGRYVLQCPQCKSTDVIIGNKYLYLAGELKKEGYRLDDQGELEKSIGTRKREIEQLQKVDEFQDEDHERAIYEQICAYGDIGRMYYQQGDIKTANDEIEKAIGYCDQLSEMVDMDRFAGTLAALFNIRMNARMNLPDYTFEDIFSDYKAAIKYGIENYKSHEQTVVLNEVPKQEQRNMFQMIEEERIRTYASMIAYCFNNKKDELNDVLKETKEFISTSKYAPEDQLIKMKEIVKGMQSGATSPPPREGCYIATTVYGDYDAPEVQVLRRFRDTVLQESTWGRVLVKAYYKCSPSIAARLKHSARVNHFARGVLDNIVKEIDGRRDGDGM